MTQDTNEPSGASGGSLAWIPVSGRLPPHGDPVLGYYHGEIEVVRSIESDDDRVRFHDAAGYWWHPTHWMPLPAPPMDAK